MIPSKTSEDRAGSWVDNVSMHILYDDIHIRILRAQTSVNEVGRFCLKTRMSLGGVTGKDS